MPIENDPKPSHMVTSDLARRRDAAGLILAISQTQTSLLEVIACLQDIQIGAPMSFGHQHLIDTWEKASVTLAKVAADAMEEIDYAGD